jgi:hypothetical protein
MMAGTSLSCTAAYASTFYDAGKTFAGHIYAPAATVITCLGYRQIDVQQLAGGYRTSFGVFLQVTEPQYYSGAQNELLTVDPVTTANPPTSGDFAAFFQGLHDGYQTYSAQYNAAMPAMTACPPAQVPAPRSVPENPAILSPNNATALPGVDD